MRRTRIRAPRRALAFCMSVLMLLTAWVFVAPTKAAAVNSGYDVTISVPELVYMWPKSNYSTKSEDVQYYINNTIDKYGNLSVVTPADNSSTVTQEGKFFLYSPDVREVDVENVSIVSGNAEVLGLSANKRGNLFSGACSLHLTDGGITSGQRRTLEWSIPCLMKDGTTATFTAYTVAYNPYISALVSVGYCRETNWNHSDVGGFAWTSGIHGIEGDGNYYSIAGTCPLVSSITDIKDGEEEYNNNKAFDVIKNTQQFGQDKKNAYGYEYIKNSGTIECQEVTPWGLLTVDTSRYTNLKQVPNVETGFHVTDSDSHESAATIWGYISDITESQASKKDSDGRITSGSQEARSWYEEHGNMIWGNESLNGDVKLGEGRAISFTQSVQWNRSIGNGLQYCYTKSAIHDYANDSSNRTHVNLIGRVKVTGVNKSDLRSVYNDFLNKYNSSGTGFAGSNWNTFKTKLKNAAEALCDPTKTAANVATARKELIEAGAAPLTLNTEKMADVAAPGRGDWFSFTPSATGDYMFFTYAEDGDVSGEYKDSHLWLYQSDTTTPIMNNDDYSGITNGARMRQLIGAHSYQSWSGVQSLTANTKYYIKIGGHHSAGSEDRMPVGSFPLKVCKAVNITFTSLGGSGDITLAMPAGHTMYMDSRTGLTRSNHQIIAWSDKKNEDELMKYMANEPLTVPDTATPYYALWYPGNENTISAPTLVANGDKTATIDVAGEIEYYQFTPTESRKYLIYSKVTDNKDSYLLFYKAAKYYNEGLYVESQDDTGHSNGNSSNPTITGYSIGDFGISQANNFFLLKPLVAGTTYLYGVKYFNGSATGTIPFHFEPVYRIHYDANGGDVSQLPGDVDKFIGKTRTVATLDNTPTRAGYDYAGKWNTAPDGSGTDYAPNATYSANEDVTLYVKWAPRTVHASLDTQSGTGGSSDIYYKFEQPAYYTNAACTASIANSTITIPTREGYTFGGYYTGQNGTGMQCITGDGEITDLCEQLGNDEQLTLYAYWILNTYTVTWQNWDETVLETDTDVPYNSAAQYDSTVPTRQQTEATLYTFAGWNDGTTNYPLDGTPALPPVTQDVTYTAYYTTTSHPYTIKFFDDDGSTQLGDDLVLGYGETPVYSGDVPTKEGTARYSYTFAGWKDRNGTAYPIGEAALPAVSGDAKYTAYYTTATNQYNITFVNYDDTVLLGPTAYDYGTFSHQIQKPETPTKPATDALIYTFSGWDPEVVKVTGPATYKAQFTPSPRQYYVTFVDDDGETILKDAALYDYDTPAANIVQPDTPTKAATQQFTYTFAGWTPALENVTDDATYKATYSSTVNQYTVTFVDDDGTTVLYGPTSYDYGTPAADIEKPADPQKPATSEIVYQFVGWSPAFADVTENATYKAVYSTNVNQYTVTFVDDDGTVLKAAAAYDYDTPGENIILPEENPTKAATQQYTYTFAGWKDGNGNEYPVGTTLPTVSSNVIYTAYYTATVNKYNVTFVDEDGETVLQAETAYDYGTPAADIVKPADPTKEATPKYTYTFAGWSPNVAPVTEDATYTATYSATINKYTITWKYDDGNTIDTEQVPYDETPAYTGEALEKAAIPQYTYTFAGWKDENNVEYPVGTTLPVVSGDATYTAYFTATVNQYNITFVDEDGTTVLKEATAYDYGTLAADIVKPADPTKPATVDLSYVFAGWLPRVVPVTEDATYTAQYRPIVNQYSVTFVDEDGTTVLKEATLYNYGTSGQRIEKPEDPTKASTYEYSYSFDGWYNGDAKLTNGTTITGNVTFKAKYTGTLNKFAVRFFDLDGRQIGSTQNVPYGSAASAPALPTKANDTDAHGYVVGWDEDFSEITAPLDVHAQVTGSTPHTWNYAGATSYRWTDYDACTATVSCTGCSITKEVTTTDISSVNTTEATCQVEGVDTYTANFGIDGLTSTKTKRLGLNPDVHKHQKDYAETSSDCTNPGYTAGVQCLDCGAWLSGHEEKPLADHIWGETSYVWAADNSACTATRICTVDTSHVESETKAATSEPVVPSMCGAQGGTRYIVDFDNEGFLTQQKEILDGEPIGHDWPAEWTVTVEPTCTEKGERTRTCSRCHAETQTEEMPALGHEPTLIPGDPGTCLTGGIMDSYKCERCQKLFFDAACLHEVTDSSQLATEGAHNFTGSFINTNDHVTHYQMCANGCGAHSTPTSHVYDMEIVARDYQRSKATCTEPAVYFKSCKCGEKGAETFVDGEPLGHAYKDVPRREATCTTDGYTAHTACSRCSYKSDEYAVLPATNHGSYVIDDAMSGQTADGSLKWQAYSCSNHCGDYYMKLTVNALDGNGNPLSGASVKITDASGRVLATGTTGDNGTFAPTNSFQTGNYHFSLTYKNSTKSAWVSLTNGTASASIGRFDTSGSGSGSSSGSGSGSGSSGSSGTCAYCGQTHTGPFGWLIQFFHTILAFFKR